jgi:hypothetical protein
MLTTLLLAATLAQAGPLAMADFVDSPAVDRDDVRFSAAAMSLDLDADALLSRPDQQRIVLSAMLCEARQRLADTELALAAGLTRPLARAAIRADQEARAASLRLQVMALCPMACGHREVQRVAECLAPAAPAWCSANPDVAAQVVAAERIAVTP